MAASDSGAVRGGTNVPRARVNRPIAPFFSYAGNADGISVDLDKRTLKKTEREKELDLGKNSEPYFSFFWVHFVAICG